jgi:hypothetical protein
MLVIWTYCGRSFSNCYLTASEEFFSHIMARISYIRSKSKNTLALNRDNVSEWSNISNDRSSFFSTEIAHLKSNQQCLSSTKWTSSQYQLYSLWFDQTRAQNLWSSAIKSSTLTITLLMWPTYFKLFFRTNDYSMMRPGVISCLSSIIAYVVFERRCLCMV